MWQSMLTALQEMGFLLKPEPRFGGGVLLYIRGGGCSTLNPRLEENHQVCIFVLNLDWVHIYLYSDLFCKLNIFAFFSYNIFIYPAIYLFIFLIFISINLSSGLPTKMRIWWRLQTFPNHNQYCVSLQIMRQSEMLAFI